jgi:uncharacterized repeat protein (TIGR03803 family)
MNPRRALRVAVVMAVAFVLISLAWGGTEKVLYNFTGKSDGGNPLNIGKLARDSSGNLFGTTEMGGDLGACFNQLGCGTVFELSPSNGSYTETTLYTFTGASDGGNPATGVILDSSGNIYGTTSAGGTSNCGTVFKLSGSTLTTLYSFTCGTDGGVPSGSVIRDKSGNLYGTASQGGNLACNLGCGVAYEISSSGAFSVIYSFCSSGGCPDGATPEGSLAMDDSGRVYGMTGFGGFKNAGTVFQLSKAGHGWKEVVLHSFHNSDGFAYPSYGGVTLGKEKIGNRNVLFGVAGQGGSKSGGGSAFEMAKSKHGFKLTVLHNFVGDNGDGLAPYGTLLELNGKIFGTTYGGGNSTFCGIGCGTVFELTHKKNAWTETVLYTFSGSFDGGLPLTGLVADPGGNLYGLTTSGGTSGKSCNGEPCGVVYEVTP